jgi:hypothetical protein
MRRDILSSRFATCVNDTGGKWKKSSIRKILIILFGHVWVVEDIYTNSSSLSGVCSLTLFPLFASGVNDTGGKFAAGVVDRWQFATGIIPIICQRCQWHWWQICRRYRWHRLPPVSITQGELVAKFAAGVVDTGNDNDGNLPPVLLTPVANLPPVSLTPVVHLDLRISPWIFEKIQNDPNVIIRGLGEGDSWKKP